MATPRSTQIQRILGGGVLVAALFVAAPAGADTTYSNGSDGGTGTEVDNPATGDPATTTTTQPATTDTNTNTDTGGTGGTGTDDLGNIDNDGELAFTGGDAISLALIGGTVVGAGSLLVLATRRKDEDE